MSYQRARESRIPVNIRARLKSEIGWGDSRICDVSSRGMMVRHIPPPPLGSYVEVCRGPFSIVGRVRWIAGDRFGVRSLEDIDLAALQSTRPAPPAPATDRRRRPRSGGAPASRVTDFGARLEASQRLARRLQFLVLVLAGMAMALILSQIMAASLGTPFEKIGAALSVN